MSTTPESTHIDTQRLARSTALTLVAVATALGFVMLEGGRATRFADLFTRLMVVVAGAAAFVVALDWSSVICALVSQRATAEGDIASAEIPAPLPGTRFRTRIAPVAQGLGFAGTLLGISLTGTSLDAGRLPLSVACRTSLIGIAVALGVTCANHVIGDWWACARKVSHRRSKVHRVAAYVAVGVAATVATFATTHSLQLALVKHDSLMLAESEPEPVRFVDEEEEAPEEQTELVRKPPVKQVKLRDVFDAHKTSFSIRYDGDVPHYAPGTQSPLGAEGERSARMSIDKLRDRIHATALVDIVLPPDRKAFREWAGDGYVLLTMGEGGPSESLLAWADQDGQTKVGTFAECRLLQRERGFDIQIMPVPVSLVPLDIPLSLAPPLNEACDAMGLLPVVRLYFPLITSKKRQAMQQATSSFQEPRDGSELIAVHWRRSDSGFEVARVTTTPIEEIQVPRNLRP